MGYISTAVPFSGFINLKYCLAEDTGNGIYICVCILYLYIYIYLHPSSLHNALLL